MNKKTTQDIHPNFRNEDSQLFLVRCVRCGRENWAPAVASGYCAWCGWEKDD